MMHVSNVCLFLFSQSRVSTLLVVGCNVRGQMSTYLDCCLLPSLPPASVVCLRTRGAGAESLPARTEPGGVPIGLTGGVLLGDMNTPPTSPVISTHVSL